MNAPRRNSGSLVIGSLTHGQLDDITRATRRPTAFHSAFGPDRIQEVILGIFRRFNVSSIDLDALVHFVLREFIIGPETFEHMAKTVKAHVFKNFAIHQGAPLRLTEVHVRRITVCHTIDKDQE